MDLAFLDANGDGRVDVCFGATNGDVFLFLGDGRGSFPLVQTFYAGPDLEALRTADLDGDGKDEILASVGNPGFIILTPRPKKESETDDSE